MKTQRPTARRAQPLRQARNNGKGKDSPGPRGGGGAPQTGTQAPGFLPALTQFTDAIDAVPREVIRQFAMLKEVETKLNGPEQRMQEISKAALDLAMPKDDVEGDNRPTANANPAEPHPQTASLPHPGVPPSGADEQLLWEKRQTFYKVRSSLMEVLGSMDEKNSVLKTAAVTLNKYMKRCETIYPFIDDEISAEARYGSTTHWAYADKSEVRPAPMTNERPRRDGAGANGAAALLLADEVAATRAENRREAARAAKNRAGGGDAGTHEMGGNGKQRGAATAQAAASTGPATKKTSASKTKKVAETANAPARAATPNIGPSAAADVPPSKRRKAEKAPASRVVGAAAPATTAATTKSPALGLNDASRGAAKAGIGSPQVTPAVDSGKKRVRSSATTTTNTKKRKTQPGVGGTTAASPSLASSPVNTHFPQASNLLALGGTTSTNMPDPGPSGFADAPATTGGRHRPSSSISNKPPPAGGFGLDGEYDHVKSTNETKGTMKSGSKLSKESSLDTVRGRGNGDAIKGGASSSAQHKTKESVERRSKNQHDVETTRASPDVHQQEFYSHPGHARQTSKASKTPTPVSFTFPEMTRSRSARGTTGGGGGGSGSVEPTSKRPRKKSLPGGGGSTSTGRGEHHHHRPGTSGGGGGGNTSSNHHHHHHRLSASTGAVLGTFATSPGIATFTAKDGDTTTPPPGEDEPEGDTTTNEPEKRYCYCNAVSYGSMVACDNETCKGEWFHWKCVGLKAEPTGSQWYCDDCRIKLGMTVIKRSE